MKLFKSKKKAHAQSEDEQRIAKAIGESSNQRDIFGRKIKTQTPVLMLDDYMITWRRQLMTRSTQLYTIASIATMAIGILLMFLISNIVLNIILGVLIIGLEMSLYLLLNIKKRYISAVANSLQIPSFNKLIKLLKQEEEESTTKNTLSISDVSYRSAFKPYNSYIVVYLSYKRSDKISDFISFSEKLPRKFKADLAKSLSNPFTKFANILYNTDKIVAKRPNISNGKVIEEADHSMVGVNLSEIARDGKKKRGGRAKNVQEAIRELKLMQESEEFVKGVRFRETAPWYLRLFSNAQLDAMLEMNMTPRQMSKWQSTRIMKSLILPIMTTIAVGIAMALSPVFPVLKIAANPLYILVSLVLGYVAYVFQAREITGALKSWRFKRSMAFAQLTQLIVPYLFLMKAHGGSLVEVFQNVSARLENPNDRALVVRLMRDMQNNPNSDAPFIDFAKSFTDDPNAVVFMTAINRSAQTKGNNDVIEDLAERAQAQLLEKVNQVQQVKEAKMVILPTYVTIIGMLINLIMVMSAMMNQMSSAMG